MALTKVSAAMFSTAAQTSDLNLDDGTLFVDSSENKVAIGNTAPAEALDITGNLTLRARGYLKLQDDAGGQFVAIRAPATVSSSVTYTFPAADGSSGQSLTTDGSGTLSWSAAAPTAGTGVTVSGTTVSIGQAVATSDSPTFTNLTLSGNLTVNGSTVTNSATNTTIEDLLIELGTGTSGTPSSDAGIVIERGSSDNVFMGWDESADVIVLGTGSFTGASSGNLTITPATLHVGSIGIGNASPDVSLDIGSKTDAVHVPVGTTAQRPGSPAAGYFRYNSTTSQFEGYTSSWGAIGGGSTTLNTDLFTGNGSTVDFTISQAIDSENKLIVFVDGVYQNPDAYSMPANTTLRFSAAPANGRKIAVYSVAGVVSGTNLNIDSFTGDGSDTTFTLSITPVNENNTLVYVGGVYQQKSTYSVSGTTLTFSTAPPSGASIEVATMNQTNINVPVDDTITTAKLVDANVTTAKIADNAVTADKIADNVALPGNITTTGTLIPTGILTANAGVKVDNITIDGTGIDLSSGDFSLDVAGDIILDADSGAFRFKDAGTTLATFTSDSGSMVLYNATSDKDLIFKGNDGGSTVTALTLDMSEGGNATFNKTVTTGGTVFSNSTSEMAYEWQRTGIGKKWSLGSDSSQTYFYNATDSVLPLSITNAGKVGIGLASPSYTFTVEKAVTNDWLSRIYNTGTAEGDLGVLIRTGSEHDGTAILAGYSGSSYKFYLQADGKLGIGTTSPTSPLHIASATNRTLLLDYTAGSGSYTWASFKQSGTEKFRIWGDYTAGFLSFYNEAQSAHQLTLASSGNIGINTSNPEHHLHVTEPGDTREDGIVKIGGSTTGLGLELKYDQTGHTVTEIVANPTYTNVNSLMRICVDRDANANQISLLGSGKTAFGTDTPYSNARVTVSGGIRFSTNVWSTGDAFNVTSWATYNNNNENSVGAVYSKLAFLTIYHSNGQSMIPIIANAGGGVAYQFTCIRPDSASAEHGAIDFTVTTDGSAGNAFRIRIGSGNGNLSVERTSGSTTFGLALHVLSG